MTIKTVPTFLLFMILISATAYTQENEELIIEPTYQKELDLLVEKPKIKQAFKTILKQDAQTLKEHILLNEIPAPPFEEEERAKAFMAMLEEIGVDSAWIDEVGNVLALRKGTKGDKTVVLDAHLDTVFPEGTEVKVRVSGDTLFAPGIGDDTRGLAMVLAVLRAMNTVDMKTESDVLFIGSVGEEGLGDLRGVKHLFSEKGPKIDSWISIDGGDLGRVNYKGLGSHRFGVSFRGPGGHSWGAFGLANPHHALGAGIHYFVNAADEYVKTGPRTSYNVGVIGGGTSVNSIPFASWMEVDIRSVEPSRLDDMDVILKDAMQKALAEQNSIRKDGRPLTVKVELIGDRPSGELSPDLPLIQRAAAATRSFGVTPRPTRGSTNANIPIAKGIPAVTIGRGGIGGWAHSLMEWWANKDGYQGTQYALLLLVAESGLAD
ncbi:MAG: M20/M25/M40 family metallo-hydrolase [Saprospiraceae bacterium]